MIDKETLNSKSGGFFSMKTYKQSEINVELIKAEFPDVYEAIVEGTKAGLSASFESEALKTAEDSIAANRNRTIGLAKVHFGEKDGEQFEQLLESGITVEQYKAVVDIRGEEKGGDAEKKGEMLGAIQKAGENLDAGQGGEIATEKDFMSMVREYQEAHNCKYRDAMLEVRKAHPKAHAQYLKSVN
jgi:hypothetical protein